MNHDPRTVDFPEGIRRCVKHQRVHYPSGKYIHYEQYHKKSENIQGLFSYLLSIFFVKIPYIEHETVLAYYR